MSQKFWTITKDLFLTLEEVQRLYSVLSDAKDLAIQRKKNFVHIRDHFILRTLLESGLRVGELTAIKIDDFHGNALIVRNGKGGKTRNILLAKGTQRVIRDFIRIKSKVLNEPISPESFLFISERRGPYTTRGVRKRVKFWFKKCGFNSRLSCHSCRHSYVSHLVAGGVDLATVRDNAGHSNIATTSLYTHVLKNDLNDFNIYSSPSIGKRNSSVNGK